MQSFNEELKKIFDSLTVEEYDAGYDGAKYMQHKITGKRKAQSQIIELFNKVIGEDDEPVDYDGGDMAECDNCGYCVHDEAPHCGCNVRNELRKDLRRKIME